MSVKLLYSLTDDKKHLKNHNQMGCMNGLFQLHHFIGRLVNHKRLSPPGDSQQTQMENPPSKAKGDKSRNDVRDGLAISCESPPAPVSSSADPSIHTPPDSSNTDTPRTASATPAMLQSGYNQSPIINRSSNHLRGIVKEHINREVPGLSFKSKTTADKGIQNIVKHIDSPRPLLPAVSIKQCSGLDESFKKLKKFKDIHSEEKDRSLPIARREGHRFSCDGRVTNLQDTLKSTLKLKEQPRLSLDSRACSTSRRLEIDNHTSPKLEIPDTPKHTSIIAKLMGLEITLESTITGNNSEFKNRSVTENASEKTVASTSRKDHIKNYIQLRNRDTSMKPISTLRLLVEPAPWKDASNVFRKPGFGEATKNIPNSMPSVYGEMEKRVKELEFKKSSSDLRALKQILEAMQKSKDSLQLKQELEFASMTQSSNTSITCSTNHQELSSGDILNTSRNLSQSIPNGSGRHQEKSPSTAHMRNQKIRMSAECATNGLSGLRKLRTLDVARQPCGRSQTTLHRDASSPTLRTDNSSITSPRTPRPKTPKLTQPLASEKNNAARSSGVVSPRLQQRQLRFDRKLQQSSLPSESTRTKGQPSDADSPVKRIQLGTSSLEKQGAKLPEVRIKSNSSIQLDYSSWSDSNISQSSDVPAEVTSMVDMDEEAAFYAKRGIKQNICRSIVGLNIIAPEQPSPVSVLDSMFYRDESPSPVKKISKAFIDDYSFNPEEQGWTTRQGTSESTSSLATNDYGVYNGEQLFEERVDLSSTAFGNSDDCLLPLSDGKDKNQEYILAILSASGLFQKSESCLKTKKGHNSAHATRPDIFKNLEMKNVKQDSLVNTLNNYAMMHADMIQKKLIFDIVNEIEGRQLVLSNYKELSFLSSRVAGKSQAKQKFLKDICSEINLLQVTQFNSNYDDNYNECLKPILLDDMQKHGPNKSEFQGEISALVLDVERLIFKDLINEIIGDAAEGPRISNYGRCRQLFCK